MRGLAWPGLSARRCCCPLPAAAAPRQDAVEIMRDGMFDRAPLSGLAGGLPVLDFRRAPGARGGKASEAARFMAALRAAGAAQGRDVFTMAELQVRRARACLEGTAWRWRRVGAC